MNIANGPVRPTPGNLNPPIDYCVQLTLPNDREWIGAFYDALYQLTYWFAWQRDSAHTGKDIAAIWLSVLANMRPCSPVKPADGCCDGGEPLYRQNPDNPCLFESSADGIHWCTLFDVSLCTPPTGQPGGGAEQPAADGGEACYHINVSAQAQALVPTVVNTGDTLTFSNFGGAANDGIPGRWDCPTGEYFFLGTCQAGTQGMNIGDPMPTQPHMSLVAQISGVWYSCLAPITVPGGVSNAQVVIQLNDVTLSDNFGDFSVDVCVTNNQSADWTSVMDFALSPYSFANVPADDGGAWVAGSGWESTQVVLGDGNCYQGLAVRKNFTAAIIDSVRFDAFLVLGTSGGLFSLEIVEYTPARHSRATTPNGAGAKAVTYSPAATMSNFEFNCAVGTTGGPCGTPPGGSLLLGKCTVTGRGPKPPEFP